MSASKTAPILTTRCQLPHRSLWFGRAVLYRDRVCIRGWTWKGRYSRVVPLERVDEVKWWAVDDDVNFMLRLDNGRSMPLQLQKEAGTWNAELHNLLGKSILEKHTLLDPEAEPNGANASVGTDPS